MAHQNTLLPFAHDESRPPNELALNTPLPPQARAQYHHPHDQLPAPPPPSTQVPQSTVHSSSQPLTDGSSCFPSSSIVDSEDGRGVYYYEERRAKLSRYPTAQTRFSDEAMTGDSEEDEDDDDEDDDEDEDDDDYGECVGGKRRRGARRRRDVEPRPKRFHDLTSDVDPGAYELPPSSPPPTFVHEEEDEDNDDAAEMRGDTTLNEDDDDYDLEATPVASRHARRRGGPQKTPLKGIRQSFAAAPLSPLASYSANSGSMVLSPAKTASPARGMKRTALGSLQQPQFHPPFPLTPPARNTKDAADLLSPFSSQQPGSSPADQGFAQAREILKRAYNENNQSIHLDELGLTRVPDELRDCRHMVWCDAHSAQGLSSDIHLYLANNRLREAPAVLFELDNLTVLSLRANRLERLPPAVRNFARLQNLSIGNNALRCLPVELFRLRHLAVLAPHPNPYLELPADVCPPDLAEALKQRVRALQDNAPDTTTYQDDDEYYHFFQDDASLRAQTEFTEDINGVPAVRYWVQPHLDPKIVARDIFDFSKPVPRPHTAASQAAADPLQSQSQSQSQTHLPSPTPSPLSSFSSHPPHPLHSPAAAAQDMGAEDDAAAERERTLRARLPPFSHASPPKLVDLALSFVAQTLRPTRQEIARYCGDDEDDEDGNNENHSGRARSRLREMLEEALAAAGPVRGTTCGVCSSTAPVVRPAGYAYEWWDGFRGHRGLVFQRWFCSPRCVAVWGRGVWRALPECVAAWEAAQADPGARTA